MNFVALMWARKPASTTARFCQRPASVSTRMLFCAQFGRYCGTLPRSIRTLLARPQSTGLVNASGQPCRRKLDKSVRRPAAVEQIVVLVAETVLARHPVKQGKSVTSVRPPNTDDRTLGNLSSS